MSNWGIRISKPGFDVKTCADYDLVISSSFNTLKTKSVGTTSGTVAHGLAYAPIYMYCEQIGSGTVGFMGQLKASAPGVDTTNFEANGTVRYYLFYQESL